MRRFISRCSGDQPAGTAEKVNIWEHAFLEMPNSSSSVSFWYRRELPSMQFFRIRAKISNFAERWGCSGRLASQGYGHGHA